MPITIKSLDHLVLTVASIERTAAFYSRVLGMETRTFGQGRVALHFGRQKINLHEVGHVLDANVRHATPGSADFCLLTETPVEEVLAHLRTCSVRIIEGPVTRTGAVHGLKSVYFYDPDENLIEVAHEVQRPMVQRSGAEA
jgi:catechol 2,3-dioxygenase-like lactoylglutathione lyase family enzyme